MDHGVDIESDVSASEAAQPTDLFPAQRLQLITMSLKLFARCLIPTPFFCLFVLLMYSQNITAGYWGWNTRLLAIYFQSRSAFQWITNCCSGQSCQFSDSFTSTSLLKTDGFLRKGDNLGIEFFSDCSMATERAQVPCTFCHMCLECKISPACKG